MDALKDSYSKACESSKAVKKPYDEQSALLNNLKVELSSLDNIRQEAYSQLQDLKQQALEKVRFLYIMMFNVVLFNKLWFYSLMVK